MFVERKKECEVKLLTRLLLIFLTFYNPTFAAVVKTENGIISLTGKDALYAVENGVVLSSEPDASTRSDFEFVILFDKRVWSCNYVRPDDPDEQSWFWCTSTQNEIINSSN